MDDFPWVYVAMILIAFVSWLHNRIKEVTEMRRQRMVKKKAAAEAARRERPLSRESMPSPFRPSPETRKPESRPVPGPEPEVELPRSFRELFEMIGQGGALSPDSPDSRTVVPPPLPEASEAPVESAKPATSPKKLSSKSHAGTSPTESGGLSRKGLSRVLRNRTTLRSALVLKEVLDSPVSLR